VNEGDGSILTKREKLYLPGASGQFQVLVRGPSGLLFGERRAVLDLETLRLHGKLSFIL